MFSVWRDEVPDPGFKSAIGDWLGVLDEIDAYSKTVLDIITPALDA